MAVNRIERGQALVETLMLGLVLLAPLIWLLGMLGEMHRAALASEAAVREAGFHVARASNVAEARAGVARSVRTALLDHGLEPDRARLEAHWPASLPRGASISIELGYPVSIVGAPFIGRVAGPSIWMRAVHVARIDPYRSRDAN